MFLTIQKLQRRLRELEQAAFGEALKLAPVFCAPARMPMAPPPERVDSAWRGLEPGQVWGETHGTTWLRAQLQLPAGHEQAAYVLGLTWDGREDYHLFLKLEATVFLDGVSIGALDWRHLTLVLPARAADGHEHILTMQVYTRVPIPFGGLHVRGRDILLWRLSQCMQTMLAGSQVLGEHELARHTLLERLNTAYNLLDLREGWQTTRLRDSVRTALDYLQNCQVLQTSVENKPAITISGHAHLDIGWRWPYWRSRQKIAHTISTVLALMERYPDFYYSQSQPQLLQWLKEDQPEIYHRVQERVREGRFELVGAMWVEADCNLPSGESFIRQILHGRRFWQEEFGVTPTLIWLPDVFGYSAALPQIMRGCNISTFMTTKISWNQFNRMPNDTFRWRGIDGSEVLTHFITAPDEHTNSTYYTYNGPLHAEDLVKTWTNYRQQQINDQLLYLCGWGDGGGGPTEEQLERLQTMQQLPGSFPHVRVGRNDAYFQDLYERVWEHPQLPTWVGELYLEYHRGTYTSQAHIKQANRRAEFWLREGEWLQSWASLYGMPERQEKLNRGWRNVLLNQFHDVLPGSSIREVYEETDELYEETDELFREVRDEALHTLRTHLFSNVPGALLVNTLPWERSDPFALRASSVDLSVSSLEVQQVYDWDGHALVLVDGLRVPSYSLNVLDALLSGQAADEAPPCSIEETPAGEIMLQNAYYLLLLAPN